MKVDWKKSAQLVSLTLTFGLLMGFGSCSHTLDEACRSQIPELEKKLQTAQLDVQDQFSQGRAIASVSQMKAKHLNPDQKSNWQEWAEYRLKEVQIYIDTIEGEGRMSRVSRPIRDELTTVADELVAFDGFTERSQLKYMERSLESAQKHLNKAAQLACTPPQK
jgi:hypothetical protein